MTRTPFLLAFCAAAFVGVGASSGQEDRLQHFKDELAGTEKVCGKPIGEERPRLDKEGVMHRTLDYRGVSLFFKMDPRLGPDYFLDDAIRHLDPTPLNRGELIEVLPCTRMIRYRRIVS